MEAINRWLFHGWNYRMAVTEVEYPHETKKMTIPRFLAEAPWTCSLGHMVDKWNYCCKSHNKDAYLVTFYAKLDSNNRKILLEWVLKNYTNEQKLF